jgi:hypothetical protein
MKTFTKCAGIAGVILLAAGSAAWAQGYNPNPGTPMSHATSPKIQGSQRTDGLTSFERAGQELYKDGYKDIYGWNRSAQGWSANAVQHGQNVHVIVADNGQITTVPRQ